MPYQNIDPSTHQKIDSLNDLQVRILVSRALDQQRRILSSVNSNDELRQALAYWSKMTRTRANYNRESVDETMDLAREIFGKESLRNDGEFANYVKGFVASNWAECAKIMSLFCSCLVLAAAKTKEQQEEFFISFPPSRDDLMCLDGTQERLEIIERDLSSNEPYFPFIGASDLVMRNIVDVLRYDVIPGNHVHIPKYLEKSLSLISDHVPPHAQSQISFAKSYRIHDEYAEMFKEFLRVDISRLLRDGLNEADETLSDLQSKLPNRNLKAIQEDDHDALREIKLGLKKFGDDNFLDYRERGSVGLYGINLQALKKVIYDLPCLRFLDKLRSEDVFIEAGKVSADESLIDCRRSLAGSEGIFAADGVNNLVILATRGSPSDKVFVLDNLWMLGQKLLSVSDKIFFDTVGLILENNPDFFDGARVELERFLPGYSNKIDDILRRHQLLGQDEYFSQINEESHIYDLLNCGYGTDYILAKIGSFADANHMNGSLNVLNDGVLNQQVIRVCQELINRPDLGKILGALKEKAAGRDVNQQFVSVCLQLSEDQRNLDSYCAVAKTIGNESVFNGSRIFHLLAESDRGDLIRDLAPAIRNRPEVLFQELNDEFPLDCAVRKGSGDFIRGVFGIFGQEDRGRLTFSSKGRLLSCLAAKHGQLDSIRALAESGYDISEQDAGGNSAIHYAAWYGRKNILDEIFNLLPRHRRDLPGINERNHEGKTPLLFAFEQGRTDLIGWMYKHGANPLIQDNSGVSPVSLALDSNNPESLRELAQAGFDLRLYQNGAPLIYQLMQSRRSDGVSTLIQAGFDINGLDPRTGETLAHYAASQNNSLVLSVLNGFGADFSKPDRRGITPLVKAVTSNSRDALDLLMSFGPNFQREFLIAFNTQNYESVGILRNLGFDINAKNSNGATLLHEVVAKNISANGRKSYVDDFIKLMELGSDPSIEDDRGFAADYLAIKNGMTKVVSLVSKSRFHEIIIDAIDKGDAAMLKNLGFYSGYRARDEESMGEDLVISRCYIYANHAKRIGASHQIHEIIATFVDKRQQQEDKIDEELQSIWYGGGSDDDKSRDDSDNEADSSPRVSGRVHGATTSKITSPVPPQPPLDISTSVAGDEDKFSPPTSPRPLAEGKQIVANDNPTKQRSK